MWGSDVEAETGDAIRDCEELAERTRALRERTETAAAYGCEGFQPQRGMVRPLEREKLIGFCAEGDMPAGYPDGPG